MQFQCEYRCRDNKLAPKASSGVTMFRLTRSTRRTLLLCLPSIFPALSVQPVLAQSAAAGAATEDQLQEVVVIGRYEFLSADTSGATNLPLAIEKVPQSISLVSEDFIKAADLKTLGEIAQYTPG